MDDVTIHIDELFLDGSTVVDQAAIAIALREHMASTFPPARADTTSRAVAATVLESVGEQRR